MVYDITNTDSFESIKSFWLGEVENYADPGTLLVLVGNNSDLR
jgi:GTPase SAR1 family protein